MAARRRRHAGPLSRAAVGSLAIRVLHIYKDYPPVHGGMEQHLQVLAEGEAERGCQVTVLVTSTDRRSRQAEEGGVRVLRAGRWLTVSSTPISPALFSRLRSLETDVTHLHHPYPIGELAHLAFGRSRVRVVTYHSDIVRQRALGRLYRPFQRRLLAGADAIVVTSEAYLQSSPSLRGLEDRCRVIPLGIDAARFDNRDPERAAALRREMGTPLVLFVGRLRYYKGLDVLIEAMESVPATLAVVGSGPMERRWRHLAGASAASSRIRFLGEVDDRELVSFYSAADVVVLPSTRRSEAFGLALLEAMAAGRPVISTELGTGTSWVNRHHETGLVVAPGSPRQLAEALRQLLGDEVLRRRLGEAARRRVLAKLQAPTMVDRVVDLYRELLGTALAVR